MQTVCSLGRPVIKQLEALGSVYIGVLRFRDVLVFVGQKGIVNKSPYEQVQLKKIVLEYDHVYDSFSFLAAPSCS